MRTLQCERCWCVWDGPRSQYVSAKDGSPATADNLTTFAETAECMHRLADGKWPVNYSIALSLDAAGVIAVSLLNCWNDDKRFTESGAAVWADMLGSYTEQCHRSLDGISVRILVRGRLREGWRVPSSVLIQQSGFVTLTCQRISPRPSWRPDPGPRITDATAALDELLTVRKPRYITM